MSDADQCADTHEFPDNLYCPGCGYNLHHAPGEQCPECGYSLVNMRSDVCRIPWEHRRELGRLRAFWKTVWMVTFRNRRFCEEYAHAVSYSDARKFRWVTLLHIYVVGLLGTAYVYLTVPWLPEYVSHDFWAPAGVRFMQPPLLEQAYAAVWPGLTLLVCCLLYLAAMTAVPSYFLHPRGLSAKQQGSAIAMSYYTCGPLAAVVTPVLVVWAAIELVSLDVWLASALDLSPYWRMGRVWLCVAAISVVVVVVTWWLNLIHLAHRIMPQVKGRTILVATVVPCSWLLLAGLILVALPCVILCVLVVFASLL